MSEWASGDVPALWESAGGGYGDGSVQSMSDCNHTPITETRYQYKGPNPVRKVRVTHCRDCLKTLKERSE